MNQIIVGGGLAGVVASILLAKKNKKVVLIEKDESLGGLLRSFTDDAGVSYDFGTHVPMQFGNSALDEILFGGMTENEWHYLDILKPCNYTSGKMYNLSQLPYIPHFPKDILQSAFFEILNLPDFEIQKCKNADEYLRHEYGNTLTESFFAPVIKKLMSEDLVNLHPMVHTLFGYQRLILGDPLFSREIKKSAFFDRKIAFHSFNEGSGGKTNFYPKQGGIGKWIELLGKKAKEAGVEILTGTTIQSLDTDGSVLKKVKTDKGDFEIDRLIWTIPPSLFYMTQKMPIPGEAPKFQGMCLLNLSFNKRFNTDNYFVYCNQPEFKSFRITLYPNLQQRPDSGPFNLTVEVLDREIGDLAALKAKVLDELIQMNLIDKGHSVLSEKIIKISNGFPIYTNKFVEDSEIQRNKILENFSNITLLGKASGKNFFMHHVLQEVYEVLS